MVYARDSKPLVERHESSSLSSGTTSSSSHEYMLLRHNQ
jgi:hypothetical protein